MTVKELIWQLQSIKDQNLEVFVEQEHRGKNKTKGVFLVFTPTEADKMPKNCVVVET